MVVLLPTSGYNYQDLWQPTGIGLRRIKTAVRILRANPDDLLIIIGGCAINDQLSEAKVYRRYFEENFPEILHQVLGVSDKGICTVQDLLEVAAKIPPGSELGFVGPKYQYRRAKLTIKALGFSSVAFLPSHEREPRFLSRRWRKELAYYFITIFDPLWQGPRSQAIIDRSEKRLNQEVRPTIRLLIESESGSLPINIT